jgi:hypothetical protein
VDEDLALLDRLQAVDAADQRALPRARGPAHHDDLARLHVEAHVGEDVERAEPLVDALELDGLRPRRGSRYSITTRTSPRLTAWPASTRISTTVPAADRAKLVLHLHGLEDEEPVTRRDDLPDLHLDEHDLAGHGGLEHLAAGARLAAARADDVAGLFLHPDGIALSVHLDERDAVLLAHVDDVEAPSMRIDQMPSATWRASTSDAASPTATR